MSDAEVIERFERGDVDEFHHADHVRVAFAYVRTMPLHFSPWRGLKT